jgi:hypothetical protein
MVWSCRQASEHQPLEVGSFSYWFDKPWFHTEERLATVLIIPSSWSSQLGGQLHAIKVLCDLKQNSHSILTICIPKQSKQHDLTKTNQTFFSTGDYLSRIEA